MVADFELLPILRTQIAFVILLLVVVMQRQTQSVEWDDGDG